MDHKTIEANVKRLERRLGARLVRIFREDAEIDRRELDYITRTAETGCVSAYDFIGQRAKVARHKAYTMGLPMNVVRLVGHYYAWLLNTGA